MNTVKITVIHHSADFDGLFCREIARKFLGDSAEYIGWDFADPPLTIPPHGVVYVMDLPVDRVFGFDFNKPPKGDDAVEQARAADRVLDLLGRIIWIDHHKSSIETHPAELAGYRIDGVAACRLAWQWFAADSQRDGVLGNQSKTDFIERSVSEPYAVRLAGEYDIWDKRDPEAEVFQFGLRSVDLKSTQYYWDELLSEGLEELPTGEKLTHSEAMCRALVVNGRMLQSYQQSCDAGMMGRSFIVEFEGIKFLALNTARCNSLTFASRDVLETGHEALLAFYFNGHQWNVSLYHARHRVDLDLSQIAVKYSGGGHRGACGFRSKSLPFLISVESASGMDAQT